MPITNHICSDCCSEIEAIRARGGKYRVLDVGCDAESLTGLRQNLVDQDVQVIGCSERSGAEIHGVIRCRRAVVLVRMRRPYLFPERPVTYIERRGESKERGFAAFRAVRLRLTGLALFVSRLCLCSSGGIASVVNRGLTERHSLSARKAAKPLSHGANEMAARYSWCEAIKEAMPGLR